MNWKLKQKSSSIILKNRCTRQLPTYGCRNSGCRYEFFTCLSSPHDLPGKRDSPKMNRASVEKKPNDPPFQPGPSLKKSVEFFIDCEKRLPSENLPVLQKNCFPSNPDDLERDENSSKHIERVYCGHLFHQECFLTT
ncbi:hypothetical protein NQ318_001550 [Aromia moschata]|uniref:Uncharacterized protein n=1 Tax=Aromia moschata TaxID=1265417 RepID=A0AAV8Y8B6_9CUCU|nr:hypothetical protein NQ318_001550 [Aromia moschata]